MPLIGTGGIPRKIGRDDPGTSGIEGPDGCIPRVCNWSRRGTAPEGGGPKKTDP